MTAILTTLLLLAPAGHGTHGARATTAVVCCDTCGVETAKVQALICTMQTHPRWQARDDAAHALRKFDWTCHPEIGPALAGAMLLDCDKHVRAEAAQSLAKLAPCQPEVHEALVRTAANDSNLFARMWAKKALKKLDHACIDACAICGPVITTTIPTRFVEPTMAPATYRRQPVVVIPDGSPTYLPEETIIYGEPLDGLLPYDGGGTLPPMDVVPPSEIPAPVLPPPPSPFLPSSSREGDVKDEPKKAEADADETPIRRASNSTPNSNRREPALARFGSRLLGRNR